MKRYWIALVIMISCTSAWANCTDTINLTCQNLITEVKAHITSFTARNHAAGIRDWTAVLNRLEGNDGGMTDTAIARWLALSVQYGWSDGKTTLPKVQAALVEPTPVPQQAQVDNTAATDQVVPSDNQSKFDSPPGFMQDVDHPGTEMTDWGPWDDLSESTRLYAWGLVSDNRDNSHHGDATRVTVAPSSIMATRTDQVLRNVFIRTDCYSILGIQVCNPIFEKRLVPVEVQYVKLAGASFEGGFRNYKIHPSSVKSSERPWGLHSPRIRFEIDDNVAYMDASISYAYRNPGRSADNRSVLDRWNDISIAAASFSADGLNGSFHDNGDRIKGIVHRAKIIGTFDVGIQ